MVANPCGESERWQPAMSARLDGEEPDLPDADLDAHLATCPACADWFDRTRDLVAHLRAPRMAPDLTHHLIGVAEAHICGCHHGEACECTDCQCTDCTCGRTAD